MHRSPDRSVAPKSDTGPPGFLSGGSGEDPYPCMFSRQSSAPCGRSTEAPLFFLAVVNFWRPPHPLAHGPFLHLQSQRCHGTPSFLSHHSQGRASACKGFRGGKASLSPLKNKVLGPGPRSCAVKGPCAREMTHRFRLMLECSLLGARRTSEQEDEGPERQ